MSEHLANSNARLEKILTQIMKEKDPLKYDALCADLWRVLDERESVIGVEGTPSDRSQVPLDAREVWCTSRSGRRATALASGILLRSYTLGI